MGIDLSTTKIAITDIPNETNCLFSPYSYIPITRFVICYKFVTYITNLYVAISLHIKKCNGFPTTFTYRWFSGERCSTVLNQSMSPPNPPHKSQNVRDKDAHQCIIICSCQKIMGDRQAWTTLINFLAIMESYFYDLQQNLQLINMK